MLILLLPMTLMSQSFHTISIDGNNDFNTTNEKFNTTRTALSAYVTWDKNFIYVAYSGTTPWGGPITDNTRIIHIYIDTDPQVVPTNGTGTVNGEAWRWAATLPFTANYHYAFKTVDNTETKRKYNGGGWGDATIGTQNYKNTVTGYWEVKIPRSDLGSPGQVNIVAYVEEDAATGSITGGLPAGLFTDTTTNGPITFASKYENFSFIDKMNPNNAFNLNNFGWSLRLKATDGTTFDTTAMAGMYVNATDGYDAGIDLPKVLPPPSNFIDVYFPHATWPSALGPNYERDFKLRADLSAQTSTWSFTVNSDISGNITLSAASFQDIPVAYGIKLKDLTTTTVTDLRTSTYSYNNTAVEGTRGFELTIGVTLSNPTITVTPTSLDFGTVKTSSFKTLGVLIKNTGDQTLNISDMVVVGSGHYTFEGTGTTATLAKNDTITKFVKFAPLTAGIHTGTFTITSNDPVNGRLVVNLTGTGQSLSPNITLFGDSLSFGSVVVVSGSGFSYAGSTTFSVLINDSTGVTVAFNPLAVGYFSGTLTITSNDPDTPSKTLKVSGTGTTSTNSKEFLAGWNLMSIPLTPTSNLASDVIGDNIASYILYKYSGGVYASSLTIDPAYGYWLGIETGALVDVVGTPIVTDQTKTLSGGWNLIASPFSVGSPKANLRILQGANTYTIDQAVTAGLVQIGIYKYNNTATPGYAAVTTLDAWNGHWFFTLASDLSVKYLYTVTLDKNEKKDTPQFDVTPSNWFVDVASELNGIKDNFLVFGTNEAATDGFDNVFDNVKPPISPAANAIESYFYQTGWTNFATKFASNIQAPLINNVNKTWSFKVYTKSAGLFKISWLDIINQIPQEIRDNYRFVLRGPGIANGINMFTQTSYEFSVTAGGTYSFVINSTPTGVEDELLNLNFSLAQNYPNPFNPSTMINYSIKETGLVTLKIYDVLGNEVASLVNDVKQAGQYEVKFEASNLPSGTYFYKLVQGKNSEIKKLLLLK
jgi:hypothetical protein